MGSQCVLVLGMHRSGTSAITKFISECGFELPFEPMQAHEKDNPLGYFEPLEIVEINNKILRACGESWKTFNDIPAHRLQSPEVGTLADDLASRLSERLEQPSRFVIKDPRICRLLPIWIPLLKNLFDELVVVQVVRAPDEVYRSLSFRSQFDDIAPAAITNEYHAFALWLHYTLQG